MSTQGPRGTFAAASHTHRGAGTGPGAPTFENRDTHSAAGAGAAAGRTPPRLRDAEAPPERAAGAPPERAAGARMPRFRGTAVASGEHVAAKVEAERSVARSDYSQKPQCRFYPLGTCRYGDSCLFSHSGSTRPVCKFYASGCRYGANCRFTHPVDEAELEARATRISNAEEPGKECCVCFDSIAENNKRFGLLTGCDHSFCLDCIMSWRQSTTVEKRVARSCPSCRAVSYFVVPSTAYLEGEAKRRFIEEYKETLARTPCKHFKAPSADQPGEPCPFGSSCFYAHLNADGTPCTVPMKPRRCPRLRRGYDIYEPPPPAAAAAGRGGRARSAAFERALSEPLPHAMLALLMQEEDLAFFVPSSDSEWEYEWGFEDYESDEEESDD